MSPACTRPKEKSESMSPKAKKVEGEDASSTTSKDEDAKEESTKMKELLEQANSMLKSLTAPASSTATSTGAAESREEVVDRLQQKINMLKLKVFKLNRISYENHQGLIDRGAGGGRTSRSFKEAEV